MAVKVRVRQSKVSSFSVPVYSCQTIPGTSKKLFAGVSNLSPVQLQMLSATIRASVAVEKVFTLLPAQNQVFVCEMFNF